MQVRCALLFFLTYTTTFLLLQTGAVNLGNSTYRHRIFLSPVFHCFPTFLLLQTGAAVAASYLSVTSVHWFPAFLLQTGAAVATSYLSVTSVPLFPHLSVVADWSSSSSILPFCHQCFTGSLPFYCRLEQQ